MEGYRCYGCDPHSEQGLRMEFYEDGEEIVSVWQPRPEFQGWVDTLHGGVQATLADEISSWVVFRKFRTSGVTSRMEVRYHKPIRTSDERVVLRAAVRQQRRNLVDFSLVIVINLAVSLFVALGRSAPRRPVSTSFFRRNGRARSFISAIAASQTRRRTRCNSLRVRRPGSSVFPFRLTAFFVRRSYDWTYCCVFVVVRSCRLRFRTGGADRLRPCADFRGGAFAVDSGSDPSGGFPAAGVFRGCGVPARR